MRFCGKLGSDQSSARSSQMWQQSWEFELTANPYLRAARVTGMLEYIYLKYPVHPPSPGQVDVGQLGRGGGGSGGGDDSHWFYGHRGLSHAPQGDILDVFWLKVM